MTWAQFKTLTIRTNTLVIGLGWVLFWGYGIAVGDIPPIKVIVPLLLISLTLYLSISIVLFSACHIALFAKAKWQGTLPQFTQRDFLAAKLLLGSILILLLMGATLWLHGSIPDAISIPLSILSLSIIFWSFAYSVTSFGDQFFRWQFSS